ncbi:hypothetical protein [Saccharibacillus endophyticus]|uniref:Gram-positive cocci surface proteins LPxTG domain-containing protein n=1 Tax=Saccharibacillus endophyticus TaxID=2060666 RepID=A0ABQ1ZXQ9_9BACL|nr:hypothetical protein [Saccharibacillus endophyticus]GGH81991.1 hypothetical protein GCM10007362_32630 [Saccharibacillus endophyticus]
MFRKKMLGAALVAAIAISGVAGAGQTYAEAADPVDAVAETAVVALAHEGAAGEYAAAEYVSIRTGDQAPAMLDMGIEGSPAASMTDGKRFSVFCISMVASLAVMLGVFGLMVRRKRNS